MQHAAAERVNGMNQRRMLVGTQLRRRQIKERDIVEEEEEEEKHDVL